jgi:hypothetical protein
MRVAVSLLSYTPPRSDALVQIKLFLDRDGYQKAGVEPTSETSRIFNVPQTAGIISNIRH